MYDIITFGSATWDVFLKPKNYQELKNKRFIKGKGICFSLGSKVDVEDIYLFSGGGGTNAAATFVKQGFKTAYFGTIGNDLAGKEIIRELRKLGIDVCFVSKTNLKPTNYSVIFNTGLKRNRTVLTYRGASEFLRERNIPWNKLKKAKWFYLAPLSGKAARLTEKIISFAKKNKIKLALNPGNSQLCLKNINKIIKKVDILILNQEEASLIGGFNKIDKICPGIIIMGSKGVRVSNGKRIYKAKPLKIKVIDRTGAGDALGSGFVSGYIKSKGDIEYALKLGSDNSSSCVQQWGAKQGLLKKKL